MTRVLRDKDKSILHILRIDPINEVSILITADLIYLKMENPYPILTVETIECGKFIDYFVLSIEANPSNVEKIMYILSALGLYQGLLIPQTGKQLVQA